MLAGDRKAGAKRDRKDTQLVLFSSYDSGTKAPRRKDEFNPFMQSIQFAEFMFEAKLT